MRRAAPDPGNPFRPASTSIPTDVLLAVVVNEPGLSVAAAARQLGIAPSTLRTWDRRYGIGPTNHTPGRHRRYNVDDLARLDLMRQALFRGATPADAAAHALATPLLDVTQLTPDTAPATTAHIATGNVSAHIAVKTSGNTELGHASTAESGHPDAPTDEPVLRLPGAGRRARGLARAATALDAESVRDLLGESITAVGVEETWEDVLRPVLGGIAQRWVETGEGIETEHLLSDCVTGVFTALATTLLAPASSRLRAQRPVLLAGMAGDQHRLPLVVLAATLAQRGVMSRSLGADLPGEALVAAIRRTAPAAVLLWSQLAESADTDVLTSLPRTRPSFRTFVAGPGWSDATLPPQVVHLSSLQEATRTISAAASR
jgi:MerR family transcriptional regulator, light-induced transcriptional regulator